MNENLENPIKEIILSVSFEKSLDIAKLQDFRNHPMIVTDFANATPNYRTTFRYKETSSSSSSEHAGYIFKSEDEYPSILNLKLGKVSFHLINQYNTYDVILEKLERYWKVILEVFGTVEVTNVSARYINQIELKEEDEVKDYFHVMLKTPFTTIENQFLNFSLTPVEASKNIKVNVVVALDKNKSIILDIVVEKKIETKVVRNISDAFYELRPIKNNIFQKLITEKTKQTFNL